MVQAKVYLPYYIVEVTGKGKRFYGEVHLSLKARWSRILVLATPRELGFEKIPLEGIKLDPLARPEEYGRIIEDALIRAEEITKTTPPFKIKGLRGFLKAMITGFKSKTPVTAGPELEAHLILYYATRALGVMPGDKLRVYPEILWLPVALSIEGERVVEAYISTKKMKERFTLLEKFAQEDSEVRTSIVEAVKSWKPL